MLDNFKTQQPIAYKIITNSIKNDRLSHAYLFETNGFKYSKDFIISFAKTLLCPNSYTNCDNCKQCHICEKIDKNIYSELKIIERDGMWIKKEQLLELQKEFKTKSVESKRKVYIINNAECLNQSSSNSLLKFLEEPQDGIVAILVTDNIHSLLDTIISRCQIITLSKSIDTSYKTREEKIQVYLDDSIELSELEQMVNDALDFIFYLEKNKLDTLLYTKTLILNKFDDRKKIDILLSIMIFFYKEVLDYKFSNKCNIFEVNDIQKIEKMNNVKDTQKKIKCIINAKNTLKINANINLLIDKLIIDLEGDVNE